MQVLNYHDAVIFDSDLDIFCGPHWLNDRCINWYFRYLEHEVFPGRDEYLFMDPAVVSCMRFQCDDTEELVDLGRGIAAASKAKVFIPINDSGDLFSSGNHWSLLIYESSTGGFYHFDSSNKCNRGASRGAAEQFWLLLGRTGGYHGCACKDIPLEHVNGVPQQSNAYDCGMYTVLLAEWFAREAAEESEAEKTLSGPIAPHLSPAYVTERRKTIRDILGECIKGHKGRKCTTAEAK
ncbi:unnamed protein product [Discosporangium mesarthrocarpum]